MTASGLSPIYGFYVSIQLGPAGRSVSIEPPTDIDIPRSTLLRNQSNCKAVDQGIYYVYDISEGPGARVVMGVVHDCG